MNEKIWKERIQYMDLLLELKEMQNSQETGLSQINCQKNIWKQWVGSHLKNLKFKQTHLGKILLAIKHKLNIKFY